MTNPTANSYRIIGVSDTIRSIPVTLRCSRTFPFTLHPGDMVTCAFQASLPDGSSAPSDVTIRTSRAMGELHFQATITFDCAQVRQVNKTIHVTASLPGAGPWTFSKPGSVSFERDYDCAGDSASYQNTATIQETGQTVTASADVACYTLDMDCGSNGAYTATYTWSLDKAVNRPVLSLEIGQTATVNYLVGLYLVDILRADFAVVGGASLNNRSPIPAMINWVTFENTLGIPMSTECGLPAALAPGDYRECFGRAPLPDPIDIEVIATIVQQSYHYLPGGSRVDIGTVGTVLPLPILYNFDLDPYSSQNEVTEIGGLACISDPNWPFDNPFCTCGHHPADLEYRHAVGPSNACGAYTVENTASFIVEVPVRRAATARR